MGCSSCGGSGNRMVERSSGGGIASRDKVVYVVDDCGYSKDMISAVKLNVEQNLDSVSNENKTALYNINRRLAQIRAKIRVSSACLYKEELDELIASAETIINN